MTDDDAGQLLAALGLGLDSGSGRLALARAAGAVQAEHDIAIADGDHGHAEAVHLARLARLLRSAVSSMTDGPDAVDVRTREEAGHRALSRSDFGDWGCRWCEAHGDDRGPGPSEVPCDTVNKYWLTRLRGVRDREAVVQGTLAEIAEAISALGEPSPRVKYEVRMGRSVKP